MIIKQISVFLQNEVGRLTQLTKVLYENNININALSVAETQEYGIMRLIVNDTEKAIDALKNNGFSVQTTDVISIESPDVPGSLFKNLTRLSEENINVSYMYGYSKGGSAHLILKVSDCEKAQALMLLEQCDYDLLSYIEAY